MRLSISTFLFMSMLLIFACRSSKQDKATHNSGSNALDASEITTSEKVSISGISGTGIIVTSATEFLNAVDNASAGDVIYVKEGTYEFSSSIRLDEDGQDGKMISLLAYPGEARPILDFSSMTESSKNRGIRLNGNYWHVKGFEIYKAGDNGMNISGSNNLIEFCSFHENSDTGLQIGDGGAHNTILNCDSYFNADSSLENADGFAAKVDCGTGNMFIGCRAWNNLDDGWDGYLRRSDNITTTYENCWAIKNGYKKDGSIGVGDGNGFKTGGSDTKSLKHNANYSNCIAAGNSHDGFDHNSNRGNVIIHNSAAYKNGRNFSFSSSNIAAYLEIKNTVSFGGNKPDRQEATSTDITNNSWQDGLSADSSDFVSVDIDLLLKPRKADGSLPDVEFLFLKPDSDLIDKGIDVRLPFNDIAPDIGAFEFGN